MNPYFEPILSGICGTDLKTARDATVRARLVLERDARGYWDSVMESFPQPGLYEQTFSDEDMRFFVLKLASLCQDESLADELRQSIISALCVSHRLELLTFFVDLLKRASDFKLACETTDVLYAIAFFREDRGFLKERASSLREIVEKLKAVEFHDETARIAKQKILENLT